MAAKSSDDDHRRYCRVLIPPEANSIISCEARDGLEAPPGEFFPRLAGLIDNHKALCHAPRPQKTSRKLIPLRN
jgi:hypothetical protein